MGEQVSGRAGETMAGKLLRTHNDLLVYQKAFDGALQMHELSFSFPQEETCALTNQIRLALRSVCAS
jgi:hypothetical protein